MPRRAYVWVYDIAGAQAGVIGRDFVEIYTDTTLDQTETLNFTIPADHPKAYLLAPDLELRLRGRRFYVHEISQERRGTETLIRVEADATWYRLGEIDHIGSIVLADATVAEGATEILAGSGWTVADHTVTTGAFSMETQDRSVLANVRTWAKITGTSVDFDTQARTVAWVAARGADLGLAFRKGRNLRNVRRRRTPPTVTALYPYGRDDLTIAGVNGGAAFVEDSSFYADQGIDFDAVAPDGRTYRQWYGKRRTIRDQSFVKEADLLAWAQAQLATEAQSIQSVEIDVVDISEITGVTEQLQPGDRCRAFDPDFDEEFSATVTRFVEHHLQPWKNVIELSTSPNLVGDPDASAGRSQQSNEWILFTGPVSANFAIRNDATYTVARIPLRFREGGRAHYHLDLWLTGVDAGTATVDVYEAEAAENVRETLSVGYTNGERVRVHLTWAAEDLEGRKDYRIRVTPAATGGADPGKGVDLTLEDDGSASFYVLAQGAVQESPPETNSVTFGFPGPSFPEADRKQAQQWTVPDNVTGPITITASGSKGGGTQGGNGATVIASFPSVIPGEVYDVYVGGYLSGDSAAWPNGGALGFGGGAYGGASSDVRPAGAALADALIVAPGGGGSAVDSGGNKAGGSGGFFVGGDGTDGNANTGGGGATQFAGGSGGIGTNNGDAGTAGQGGDGADRSSGLGAGGGGGGGGIQGGGGGGATGSVVNNGGGGGGGGSGLLRSDAFDITISDGAYSDEEGQVVISWETPA